MPTVLWLPVEVETGSEGAGQEDLGDEGSEGGDSQGTGDSTSRMIYTAAQLETELSRALRTSSME